MSDQWPGVSARGVLDGEAEALAGLCDSRGPSVVGYCACVCGAERAVEAAAAAFAAFRAGAARAADPLALDPEALLLGRTRAAAAQRAPRPAESLVFADVPCPQIPPLLAENASGSISPGDQDRLRQHLARCVGCRATQAVWEQAERAYFHPTLDAVDPVSRLEIIEALKRAVPPPTTNVTPVASANGGRPPADPAAGIQQATVGPQPRLRKPLPRTAVVSGRALSSTPVGQSQPARPPESPSTDGGAPAPVEVVRSSYVAGGVVPPPGSTGSTPGQPAHPPTQPAPPSTGQPAHPPTQPAARSTGPPAPAWDSPTGVMSAVDLDAALGDASAGVDPAGRYAWPEGAPSPAPADPHEDSADPPSQMAAPFVVAGARRLTVPRVLGPVAVLVVGVLVALFIAGVFSGGSPHPNTNPLDGAQANPSATAPTAGVDTNGTTALGGGSAAAGNPAASAGVTTAASRAAAKKRAATLARKLQAANGTGAARTKPTSPANGASPPTTTAGTRTTNPASGSPATKPTTGGPAATPTTAPSKPTTAPAKPPASGPVTVHELGAGTGSAPPITGVPATGATGYQPG